MNDLKDSNRQETLFHLIQSFVNQMYRLIEEKSRKFVNETIRIQSPQLVIVAAFVVIDLNGDDR